MTAEEFAESCARACMRPLGFTRIGLPTQDEIPYSDLAMHCRVAGQFPVRIALSEDERCAFVLTTAGEFVRGLTSEVVPFAARPPEMR